MCRIASHKSNDPADRGSAGRQTCNPFDPHALQRLAMCHSGITRSLGAVGGDLGGMAQALRFELLGAALEGDPAANAFERRRGPHGFAPSGPSQESASFGLILRIMRRTRQLRTDPNIERLHEEFWGHGGSVRVKARVATGIMLVGAVGGITWLLRGI
jgi:hypothetical protein